MKILNIVIIVIVALLSIAAGLAKVLQSQQEMDFLLSAGLSPTLIIVFGVVQLAGGVMLSLKKTRIAGAVVSASAFAVSSILIFISGNTAFGLISIIPVALTCFVLYQAMSAN